MDWNKHAAKTVFGLDIGTRSIVGTVGYRSGEQFIVIAQKIREHETRAMLDGQIHDIGQVGSTIAIIKDELEKETGLTLTDVCIAAAGRVLRTVEVRVGVEYEEEHDVTEEDIYGLEALGVEKAYRQFQEENQTETHFYCVGSTVIKYFLNEYPIGNLENHRARKIEAEMIATFLPDEVVDGLYKAVELAGLQVVNMTLEPIAAIQVAIPQMYRMLNIALVDVGAGTSDISITREGSIVAYGMIPVAGDSLTEVIAQHCLVDFNSAELIKRGIGEQETVAYQDIMGLKQTITRKEVLSVIQAHIDEMAKLASDKIKELNGGKSVSAVFVVGGGGKIPGYVEALAKELGIVRERVALRGEEVMQKVRFMQEDIKKDSLLVTPIGICLCFYEQSNHFIHVTFNHKRVKLYDNSRLAVVDAAIQADFPNEDMFPKRGQELVFTLDGKTRRIRGEAGEAAVIHVNGAPADITTLIRPNDMIDVEPSTAGAPASCVIGKLPEYHASIRIRVNGKEIDLPKYAVVNGVLQSEYYEIAQNDVIEINNYYTVEQIKKFLELEDRARLLVNHMPADEKTRVYENFSVDWGTEADAVYMQSESESESWLTDAERAERGLPPRRQDEGDMRGYENVRKTKSAQPVRQPAESMGEQPVRQPIESMGEQHVRQSAERMGEQPVRQPAESMGEKSVRQPAESMGEKSVRQEAGSAGAPSPGGGSREQGKTDVPESGFPAVSVIVNGQPVTLRGKKSYIYVDVFDYIDFDLSKPHGSSVVTLLNGESAGYVDVLCEGDKLEIYWEK